MITRADYEADRLFIIRREERRVHIAWRIAFCVICPGIGAIIAILSGTPL